MTVDFNVPDGLDEIRHKLPDIVQMIAATARWVHPDAFRALPVWYPETARGRPIYDATWTRVYTNTKRQTGTVSEKAEPNIKAGKAFVGALGVSKVDNWTVCHIWGVDDPKFQLPNRIISDPRYYSCVGNMVWLPTPLKAFTDAMPEVKTMIRTCAYHLYGWVCEHEDVADQARTVREGALPAGYPEQWPTAERRLPPPGTALFLPKVTAAIERRKSELRRMLADDNLVHFPRDEVREVLAFWGVRL